MKNLSIMLKPASSLCNLCCKYCFYADVASQREISSFGIMSEKAAHLVLDHIFSDTDAGDHVTFAFQGGEPMLAGLSFFEDFVAETEKRKKQTSVAYALQTNATLLNEAWCSFLKKYDFLVGISLDGTAEQHDAYRVDRDGHGTFKRVMVAKKLLDKYEIPYNVLMTLTNSLARHPRQVWNFIKKNNLSFVQFTPCLAPLDSRNTDAVYALTPRRFSQFYTEIFSLWFADWKAGSYTSIKLIDDLVHLLSYGMINSCGLTGKCSPQIIVEADGSVYPCDFYTLDAHKAGNLCEESLESIYTSSVMTDFRYRKVEIPAHCKECSYWKICGGGCKRMRPQVCLQGDDSFCGYQSFLDFAIRDLQSVALEQRRYSCYR